MSRNVTTKYATVIEDLAVRNMVKNRSLARAIADAGWGDFRRMLEYKATWYGCRIVVADRFYPSSKTCSACGFVTAAMPMSERVFRCEGCGLVIDRDLNAAINLEHLGQTAYAVRRRKFCGDANRPSRCCKTPQGSGRRRSGKGA